jgi:hypothetical protein
MVNQAVLSRTIAPVDDSGNEGTVIRSPLVYQNIQHQ